MKQINIFALGDSITYGFPYGPRYSWVEMASQKLEIKIINGGINGDTTAFMLQRLPQALSCRPSHLLILGGANDAYWGQPVSSVGLNIKEICQNCRQEGIEAIIGLPTPVDEPGVEVLLSEYRSYFLNIAAAYNNVVIPFHQAFFDSDGRFRAELTTDGCHPNIEGYEAMAEVAEKALMEILA